jgi:acyl-CoA reductase-like NAD-dependent aldehyde dehydrogenase
LTREYQARNPYTGELDYSFTDPTDAELEQIIARLKANQPAWWGLGLEHRIETLLAFRDSLLKHGAAIVDALTHDTGRRFISSMELQVVTTVIDHKTELARTALADAQSRQSMVPDIAGWERREPLGLVANITPWNFPMILSFMDSIPALVAGNAVIIKASEVTPRWVEPLQAAIRDCPEIASVLEIIAGTGAVGAELINHADAVAFTGSVTTGEKVYKSAAENFIPAFLELGGKDPLIVLESADVAMAAKTAAVCTSQSAGQACQSIERVYVHENIYDEFVAKVIETAQKMAINYPDIDAGPIGPFIFDKQAGIVAEHIRDAVANGAVVETGGEIIDHGGKWMAATVLTNVNHDMQIMREETFGPVAPIMKFSTVEEAISLANDSKYGLSAAVFAGTNAEAKDVGARVNAGAISINDAALNALVFEYEYDPYGHSGLGRARHGIEGIKRFTREKAFIENSSGQSKMVATYKL